MLDWDHLATINDFVLCIPLKIGATIVALIGLVYGFIATYLFISMCVNYNSWKAVYASKLDELIYFFFIFAIVTIVFIASIILLIAICLEQDLPIQIYLWSIVVHISLNWLITIGVSLYCFFINLSCFLGSGIAEAWVNLILTLFYTVLWCYFIVTVNSFRMDI